jgi:hypothetical protein
VMDAEWALLLSVGLNSDIHLECVFDCDCAGLPLAFHIACTSPLVL